MAANWNRPPKTITIDPAPIFRTIGIAIFIFIAILFFATATYIVQPGTRGVAVTLGKVDPKFRSEGFGIKQPFITTIHPVIVRQQTQSLKAECYSSDLQQVSMEVTVLYRVPEQSAVKIFQQYAGDPFDNLIGPQIQEAIKEVAATHSAEHIVKKREEVKQRAIELARKKIGKDFLEVIDVVLYNIALSHELEQAIEQKMVQEQEAAKAKFTQLKAQIEAETAIIRAKGEAEAITVRGQALRANPAFIKLEMVQTWNGRAPLVVGSENAGNLLLQPPAQPAATATRPNQPQPQRRP